jgi:long-chain acyl-CoA synthetase
VQEYTSPGEVAIDPSDNLTRALWAAAETKPGNAAVAVRVGDRFVEWSNKQLADEVLAVAKGLKAKGIGPGDCVAIFSSTRLEWTILDFAIWAAGGTTVPIYETSSAEQVAWIISDSGTKAIMIETPELRDVYGEVEGELPGCEHALVIDEGAIEELRQAGASISDEDMRAVADAVIGEDLATIVYTSGTTGRPKGCLITHGNFVWDATQVEAGAKEFFREGEKTLLFLPLAHIFARIIQTASIRAGVTLGYSTGIPNLMEELGMFKPTFLLAVPRVFEKVFNGAQQKAHGDGKGKIFDKAADVAVNFSKAQADGSVPLGLKIQHTIFDKLVYSKLRAAVGGNVRYAVSGGAALGERLGHFFNGVGILILEGYGLTETTAGATINRPDAYKIGTVGKPVPGASVRIAADGEVLIKGGNVFQGYYNNEEATKESMTDDGWYHTGDIGSLDGEGYLRITGRKKEIIVTAGGKNVAPAVLEDRMRGHFLVSQSMVIGDNQPFIAALITIDPEAFEPWAEENGKSGRKVADLVDDPDLRAEIQKAVDDANKAVSKAESIRTFRILPEDFEVGVELSQKMSVKRHVVSEKFAGTIEDIYAGAKK